MTASTPFQTPELIDPSTPGGQMRLQELRAEEATVIVNRFGEMLAELCAVRSPEKKFSSIFEKEAARFIEEYCKGRDIDEAGRWVYFPWNHTLCHILPEDEFLEVRTSRNKELITDEEQIRFYNAHIAIAGLSVGMSIALSIVLEGGGKYMKIADNDTLELSNTNRILAGVADLGKPKIAVLAERIYAINPYADIECFSAGITEDNARSFMAGCDILVEEVDSLPMKFLLREVARTMRIPVVMATDLEEGTMVDVDRYDVDPTTAPFSGRFGDVSREDLATMEKRDIGLLVARFVGDEHTSERMRKSLRSVGTTLVSWPQIGGAALMSGALAAYVVRRIIHGDRGIRDRIVLPLQTAPVAGWML